VPSKERQIIQFIKDSLDPSSAVFIGDDCAYLKEGNLLLSTDAMVEGVHFLPCTAASVELADGKTDFRNFTFEEKKFAYYIGWKVVAVNVSDIAAMGGLPTYFLLSASLPKACDEDWINNFLQGVIECCSTFSVKLVGGDLTGGDKVYLCGTIMGKTVNARLAKRSSAKPGQKILVSGHFGRSAAGLWALSQGQASEFPNLVKAHLKPIPRVKEAFDLVHNAENVALMDASDGLLDCLQQTSEQSGVRLKLDLNALPREAEFMRCAELAGRKPQEWMLIGGEDYELIACTDGDFDHDTWIEVGYVTEGQGVEVNYKESHFDFDALKIFDHFC